MVHVMEPRGKERETKPSEENDGGGGSEAGGMCDSEKKEKEEQREKENMDWTQYTKKLWQIVKKVCINRLVNRSAKWECERANKKPGRDWTHQRKTIKTCACNKHTENMQKQKSENKWVV